MLHQLTLKILSLLVLMGVQPPLEHSLLSGALDLVNEFFLGRWWGIGSSRGINASSWASIKWWDLSRFLARGDDLIA